MRRVVIGMDPYERSVTIRVPDERETVLVNRRFDTDATVAATC